jgi:hypothetical protein
VISCCRRSWQPTAIPGCFEARCVPPRWGDLADAQETLAGVTACGDQDLIAVAGRQRPGSGPGILRAWVRETPDG